ncbi:MAG TPA: PAS domain S-box protein [Rubrobacteraceae bacterium]|nr:PAS domain S-box protein [Rubrobacteraceae bacterium]
MRRGEALRKAAWIGGMASAAGAICHCVRAGLRLKRSERRLRNLVYAAADGFFVHDVRGRILDVNRHACESLGYTREELLTLNVTDIEQSFTPEEIEEQWRNMSPEAPVTLEGVHRRKDGTTFPVEVRLGLLDSEGEQLMFALARDITERKRAEAALRESERRFRQLFENSADALFVHDEFGRILDCNAEACESLGYKREELLSMNVGDISVHLLTEEERRERAGDTLWERVMRGEPGRIVSFVQDELRRRDGTTFPVEVGVGAIEYEGARAIFASVRDITARQELEDELRQQALRDPLRDLPNRALFMDRLEHALRQAERRKKPVAVLFVDLDNFKPVNDSLGHEAGDQLLIGVARRISTAIRGGDTAARLGGDEFTILLEDLNDAGDAALVAERILGALDEPFRIKGRKRHVTASLGIALSPSSGVAPAEILNKADEAMYKAKEGGKARYEFSELPPSAENEDSTGDDEGRP